MAGQGGVSLGGYTPPEKIARVNRRKLKAKVNQNYFSYL